jgi:uncharacterized protein DUF4331
MRKEQWEMKRGIGLAAALAAIAGAAFAAAFAGGAAPEPAAASSHREAPLISEDPGADNTDLYAFRTADAPGTVTIVANYIPLEEPAGGPNFAQFDDDVLYEIHVDNDGDAVEDLTYQFRFKTGLRNPNTFLYNTGPIGSIDSSSWNRPQTYTVTRVDRHTGISQAVVSDAKVPPVNIGPRSTPAAQYDALAQSAVRSLPNGSKYFAGQRDDPFFVDLGSIFDLGGLRPFNSFHLIALGATPGVDGVGGYNTHSIVMQVPIAEIGHAPNKVLGIYASASRQSVRILKKDGSEKSEGAWTQVSRLGNPLVNEVLIPLGQKDLWNRSEPEDDAQFAKRYTDPELAGLVNGLYPALPDTPTTGRGDLVTVLLTGIPGVNSTGPRQADLLRLNLDIAPSAPVGQGDRLAALAGDLAGFPNGRRLEDDVTDIELRAVACGYGDFLQSALGLCNLSPNNLIGDGVDANEKPFSTTFPYVASPHQGYSHAHH